MFLSLKVNKRRHFKSNLAPVLLSKKTDEIREITFKEKKMVPLSHDN